MRGLLLAGVLCAGGVGFFALSIGVADETWTYHDCVQECRDNLPANVTLQRCIIEENCEQYPRPHRTYQDCVDRCETEAGRTGRTLQQCVARYVCSQYPRK